MTGDRDPGPQAASRRGLLGLAGLAMLDPGRALAAPDPSTDPTPGVEFAFEEIAALGPAQHPGATPFGERNRIPITGGTFKGPRISGKIVPGGADWQLIRNDKALVIEADYMIQADDGTLIHVYNKGIIVFAPGGGAYARTAPIFEAPIGPHDWLNQAIFVGTLGQIADMKDAVRVRVFKVT